MTESSDKAAPGSAGDEATAVAAVDLGSNSFHMLVARAGDSGLQVIDRLREPVRLAAGLQRDKTLDPATEARAMECLVRFGQRLRELPAPQVRVVGTNTMRRLRRAGRFITQAERALGHRVEVISGVEEARLVYGGVTHGLPPDGSRRLVVDIGGGSTELIIGRDNQPELMESVHLGCVSHTQNYFAKGKISRRLLEKATLAASASIKYLERSYRQRGWDLALGASGSVRAVWRVGAALGVDEHRITPACIRAVSEAVIDAGHIDKLDLPGLREDRRPVFVGSLAVLAGIFDSLQIEALDISDRALREGVLYDLLGRLNDCDVRDQSTQALAERFQLDQAHARRVQNCALGLWQQVARSWQLEADLYADFLRWAAQLHEIGMAIAHGGYHKHSAYVLAQVDLHGFSRTDQQILAAITRCHRGKWSNDVFEDLREDWRWPAQRLAILLRLAVILNRGRSPEELPPLQLDLSGSALRVRFPGGWLADHALTRADLEQEAERLKHIDFTLEFG